MKKEQYPPNTYEAPAIEIIEVEVEKGFTLSGNATDSVDSEFGYPHN